MTPRQLCNVVYAYLIEGADQEHIDKIDASLREPLDPRVAEARTRTAAVLANIGALGRG